MEYQIKGNNVPVVEIKLNQGEKMISQSGGLAWMNDAIKMDTNMRGGFGKSLARMFGGESLFMSTFTATRNDAMVTFASGFVGNILPLQITRPIIAQKTAFLCGQDQVNLDVVFTKKFTSGLFGGEGFILQRLSGSGMAFLEIDGDIIELELSSHDRLRVDTGHIAAFEDSVQYNIEVVGGMKNMLFGGEGLFLATLSGPGKVYLQTMNVADLANKLIPYIPRPSNS
ncbi:MAG: TIGR00266 family protein [Erysipelotrichaceae bacterium]